MNLKYDTNKPVHKIETDSQTQRIDLWLPKGGEVGEGWIGSLGLADTNDYIQNGTTKSTRLYRTVQGTTFNIL